MAVTKYSSGHYQTFRSEALDATIQKKRDSGGMVGEDTYGHYDASINFDYVCRFLMSKYPDFIPVPGTDRRTGILYADDMGLSVELKPYTDKIPVPYITKEDIMLNPKWTYNGNYATTSGVSLFDQPYEHVRRTTPRDAWPVIKSHSNATVAGFLIDRMNRDIPLNWKPGEYAGKVNYPWNQYNTAGDYIKGLYNGGMLRPNDKLVPGMASSMAIWPIDMKYYMRLNSDAIKENMHHDYEPDSANYRINDWPEGRRDVAFGVMSPTATEDGNKTYHLEYRQYNDTFHGIGPIWAPFGKVILGWEDCHIWAHMPQYIYPCSIAKAGLNEVKYAFLPSPAQVVYTGPVIGTRAQAQYYAELAPAAITYLAAQPAWASWCLRSLSWKMQTIERAKWVARTTPAVITDELTRHKKLVIDRVIYAAEHMGTKNANGTYDVTIDGKKYALPAAYAKKEAEPENIFSIYYNVSTESDTTLLSGNFTPVPEQTTLYHAISHICSFSPSASVDTIMKAFTSMLYDMYTQNGTLTVSNNTRIKNAIKEAKVAAVVKMSTQGNVDHIKLYGTYKDGSGLKGVTKYWKESKFTADITVTNGDIPQEAIN